MQNNVKACLNGWKSACSPSGWTTFQLGSHVFIGRQSEKDVRAGTWVVFFEAGRPAVSQPSDQANKPEAAKTSRQTAAIGYDREPDDGILIKNLQVAIDFY